MLKNYIRTALRNLWKYKGYATINILGLAIGMACVILIMLYVQGELNYDTYHQNKDRIYRLNINTTNPNTGATAERSIGPYRLADELKPDFPDFEAIVRFAPQGRELVEYQDLQFAEEELAFVDPNVFSVFDFPLLEGDPSTALEDPFSLVVTDEIAQKYFGSENPMGKTLNIRDEEFEITGIMAEVPSNSQFQINMMVSMNCAQQVFSRIVLENWGEGSVATFAMTEPNKGPDDYEERLAGFVESKLASWSNFSPKLRMQALPDIYLHSQEIGSFVSGGDIVYVYAFSFIALFILIIACINFMNLSTARSSLRTQEVGLRKVVGAERHQLIGQFLSESSILALLSLGISLFLAFMALPYFNQIAETSLSLDLFGNSSLLIGLLVITIFVGIIAGSYPALLLSGFKPIQMLSGHISAGGKSGNLRKVLVAFQFATSIFLLAVTAIVYQQLQYCKNKNLGFEKEHLILLGGTPLELRGKYEQFTNDLMSNPRIVSGGGSSRVPPGRLSSSLRARPEGVPEDEQRGMQTIWTDFGFIETMGFEIAAGRSFSRDYPSDATTGFVLNEAAVKDIGWTNETAIGKAFGSSEIKDWNSGQWELRDGQVIGVLKDFHFETLKNPITPTVYFVAPYMAWNYLIRITPGDVPATIAHIEDTWEKYITEVPFEFTFVDENYDELYRAEERQGKIFGIFASLAIFIACLGLIGLASFTAEQKKKEVGIRKVLGASSVNIIMLLSREFTWLIIIAFIVASPIAWYTMNGWLQDFAYHIPLNVGVFIFAGLMSLLIAWVTVSLQTARAALANPIDSIQQE